MEPLIWTTKGNLPVASLRYAVAWDVQEEYAKLTETYWLGEEIVRQSAHVYDKRGINAAGIAAKF